MGLQQIEAFFSPKSVALIGASTKEGSVGNIIAKNLAESFQGPLHFISTRPGTLLGRPVHASLATVEGEIDLGIISVPAAYVPEVITALGEKGARAAVIISAGLGHGPGSLNETVLANARLFKMRIIGPNCIGVLAPPQGLNASFSHRPGLKGDLALISQSGAVLTSVVEWAERQHIGFSALASIGDASDVHFPELIDHFALDHRTRAILLYVEAITDARAFMSAARAAARTKPVVVIKSGRHAAGAKAAASHTGALAGVDAVYDAAFRRAGLLRVSGLEQLFAAAETLSLVPRSRGRRLAILTNGGGIGVLAVDDLIDLGGTLATLTPETLNGLNAILPAAWSHGNPVDIVGDATAERYEQSLALVLNDAQVDAVLVMNCPTALGSSEDAAEAVIKAVRVHRSLTHRPKPVIAAWLGGGETIETRFAAARIPCMRSPQGAVEGIMHLVHYAEAQEALTATPPDTLADFKPDRTRAQAAISRALADGRSWLMAQEVYDVLDAYEIPAVPTVLVTDARTARAAAAQLLMDHKALVAKIASPDIIHKSDVGGVELELSTVDAVGAAVERISKRAASAVPGARLDGVTLHPMVFAPKAVELIAGVADDAIFGPVIVFGRGGTAVEVINDKALALPPLDMNLAQDLIRRTRVDRQIAGYRDRKPVDRERLASLLVKLSQLVAENPQIRELDLNPIIAQEDRIEVVDARISVKADTALGSSKTMRFVGHPRLAIRPYPSEWEGTFDLKNGISASIRPIRPEDERYYPPFFEKMTDEDMRLRFFSRVRELGHSFTARLTQIDYGRAMAFIAIDPATDEMLGAVRLHGDPDGLAGEYGIAIRSDLKGEGLGWELMRLIIRFAGREGYQWVRSTVLRENTPMLQICEALGFTATASKDDYQIMEVALDVRAALKRDPTLA